MDFLAGWRIPFPCEGKGVSALRAGFDDIRVGVHTRISKSPSDTTRMAGGHFQTNHQVLTYTLASGAYGNSQGDLLKFLPAALASRPCRHPARGGQVSGGGSWC